MSFVSITASADRSRDVAARLKDESDELKSRIESAKDEEERDRKRAEELEEELADQLDELERINGTGSGGGSSGVEKAVSKEAVRSASFGDAAASVGDSDARSGRNTATCSGRHPSTGRPASALQQ